MGTFVCVVGANCNSPILQITHVTNCPHVEGLIAISPYTGVIRTFANIHVNTQKRYYGHGMGSFACVVGAICKSPPLQIVHVFNCPHVEGLIAISPYTCVIRTFANIRVNTQKKASRAWYEGVCVRCRGELQFAPIPNSPMLQFAPIPNRPYCEFTHISNLPLLQIYPCYKSPLCGRANCN